MSPGGRQRYQIAPPEINRMETRLGAALYEISPRPAFVSNLRSRLEHEPPRVSRTPGAFQALLVSLASVIGALVLMAALVRGLQALLILLGMLEGARRSATHPAQTIQ